MKAERLERGRVRLSGKVWADEFGEDRRLPWIAFYDKMHADYGFPGYKAAADALRSLGDCEK
ncbi:hypothetical protein [Leisingera sp. M523]|uniref:hypothetical protein n=1 Tax=Leisingera sp. M523 TaxID=2867013 RepID=UPI0021A42A52|nr:hypothetical protein [Leisingera sp. M523]UWQ30274.1 hypothetical protein K3557_06975 [Leisingera sp. M523]